MSPQSKQEMKDVRMTGKRKGWMEIRSPGEEEADGALRMEGVSRRYFLETDDCLETVSRETPTATDGKSMKTRAADWPGEDCQASESNADLRLDQPPAAPGTRPEAQLVAPKPQRSSWGLSPSSPW